MTVIRAFRVIAFSLALLIPGVALSQTIDEAIGSLADELGRVDKRDSQLPLGMIQAGICDGDQLGTRPDVGRGMGVL